MTLSKEDADLFFKLFIPMLQYINTKYKIVKNVNFISRNYTSNDAKTVADMIWGKVAYIDEYLASDPPISEEEKEILQSWKKCKKGDYILLEHGSEGSYFMLMNSKEDPVVYLVKGLTDPWSKILPRKNIPAGVKATLLPFKDTIITDGLIAWWGIKFDAEFSKQLTDLFELFKKDGDICSTLDGKKINGEIEDRTTEKEPRSRNRNTKDKRKRRRK